MSDFRHETRVPAAERALFRRLTSASFAEVAAQLRVRQLTRVFAAQPDIALWLQKSWCPRRADLGLRLRDYLHARWPDFDWLAAYRDFCMKLRLPEAPSHGSPSAASAAFALYETAAQAQSFYEALARDAQQPALAALGRGAAAEHASFFNYFGLIVRRCEQPGGFQRLTPRDFQSLHAARVQRD